MRWFFVRRLLIMIATIGFPLLLAACGSDQAASERDDGPLITSPPDSNDPASTTSDEPADGSTTTGSTGSTESTEPTDTAATGSPCVVEPSGSHTVVVRLDDGDGGLNLRDGVGTDQAVQVVLPFGTEVEPTGQCGLDAEEAEWWQIRLTTDRATTGWVHAGFLTPRNIQACGTGAADFDGLEYGATAAGDFDGDGLEDLMIIATGVADVTGVALVELGNGGFASSELGVERTGEILKVIRPIGSDRDMVIFQDVLGSGASRINYLFAELKDCSIRTFEGFMWGGSVGSGNVGFCLEPTLLGTRVWVWGEQGDTPEERAENRFYYAYHYANDDLYEVDLGIDEPFHECLTAPVQGESTYFGHTDGPPNGVIGLEIEPAGELAVTLGRALSDAVGASDWRLIGSVNGIDAVGSEATFELTGLGDDSVLGYRITVQIETRRSADGNQILGHTVVRARNINLCLRGVSEGGLCV